MTVDRKIEVEFSGVITLSHAEVWPDGDAPDNWTAADVAAAMRATGRKIDTLDKWNLTDDIEVTVSAPNPAWRQDEALFPEHAEPRTHVEQVWP
jgi:hypothetical protein